MSKITHNYETLLVLDVTKTQEQQDALIEKFKSLIEKNGKIESVDLWGKRRLAYPINDLNEGFYVVIHFVSEPDFPRELDRIYRITDGLLRTIIIHKDERYLDVQVKLEREGTRTPRPAAAKPAPKAAPAPEVKEEVKEEAKEEPPAEEAKAEEAKPAEPKAAKAPAEEPEIVEPDAEVAEETTEEATKDAE